MDNTVRHRAEIDRALRGVTEFLNCVTTETGQENLAAGDSASSGPERITLVQLLFKSKFDDPLISCMVEQVLNHAIVAERLSPGAFLGTLRAVQNNLSEYLKGNLLENNSIYSCVTSKHGSSADLEDLVFYPAANTEPIVCDVVRTALDLAGFAGRIMVEKTHAQRVSVELCSGYCFNVRPPWSLSVRLDNPRALIIDGYVQEVSELHHLLEAAASSKEQVALFVRGLSDDVLHTLRVNYDRGSLCVVPLLIQSDLEGINTVNDIATVAGCLPVSSNKGDLVSSVRFEALPRVGAVTVYPSKVIIQERSTARAVAAQVSMLKEKRRESHVVEDVSRLYDARMRSLCPGQVIIRLPAGSNFVRRSQAIDTALRTVKALVDHGTISGRPAMTEFFSNIHAKKCTDTLLSTGAALTGVRQ